VEKKREGGKQDGKGKPDKDEATKTQSENGMSDTKERDGKPKPKKNIECFTCGENHYASNCPHRKKLMSAKQQQEGQDDGNAFVNAAWEANVYHTYQVNAMGMSGFSSTEVLLDNQADISIMRPELLRQLRPTNGTVRVNGVGGVQLELRQVGYLEDFLRCMPVRRPRGTYLALPRSKRNTL